MIGDRWRVAQFRRSCELDKGDHRRRTDHLLAVDRQGSVRRRNDGLRTELVSGQKHL